MNDKFSISKSKISAALVMILMLTSLAFVVSTVPAAKAQGGSEVINGILYTNVQPALGIPLPTGVTPDHSQPTIAHLSIQSSTIGVGQIDLINFWLNPALLASRAHTGYLLTFTAPDGTKSTVGPFTSFQGDTTAYYEWVAPDVVGKWQIQFNFPGDYFPAGNYSVTETAAGTTDTVVTNCPQSTYYEPCSDGPYNVTVQTALLPTWPNQPPIPGPGDYWSRPVNPTNRDWWPILGNYPATGVYGGTYVQSGETMNPSVVWPADTNIYMSNYGYTPYVTTPTSAHIVWMREGAEGGLLGGELEQLYQVVQGYTDPNIVYDGMAYQTVTAVVNGVSQSVWECFNLQTGQILWQQTGITHPPTMITEEVQVIEVVPGASNYMRGDAAYLLYVGGGLDIAYDPFTGNVVWNVSIAPLTTGTFYMDPYFLSVQTIGSGTSAHYRLINWTIWGGITPGGASLTLTAYSMHILNNITWPFSSLGSVDYESGIAAQIASPTDQATGIADETYVEAASITTGTLLWNESTNIGYQVFSGSTECADHGMYVARFDNGYYYCWNLNTGKLVWQSAYSSWPWGCLGNYGVNSYGGMVIYCQYDGIAAYNWTNGDLVWLFRAPAFFPLESPYAGYMAFFTASVIIADGMLYVSNTEHTPTQPITRGWSEYCINVTTGTEIWTILGEFGQGVAADGYLEASNGDDGYMYTFGMGLSATTVSAPQTQITEGQSATITGTVLDQSPAQPGTPCVSDTSMTTYMEYLHMQEPITGIYGNATITGIPVSLSAVEPNGNTIQIGIVTTDPYSGTFGYAWAPPNVPGLYKITATYAGDDSYSYSSATTYLTVVAPPTVTPTPTPVSISGLATTSSVITYTLIAAIAIIIAIAIVAILMLRKRP